MSKHCFVIVRRDESETETYFGGFFNETELPGTQNESQCWELEDWFDNPNSAWHFRTHSEARDFLANIDKSIRNQCTIRLYGWNDVMDVTESNWYPLKDFI